jgi:hypothetical protein
MNDCHYTSRIGYVVYTLTFEKGRDQKLDLSNSRLVRESLDNRGLPEMVLVLTLLKLLIHFTNSVV